MPANTLFASQSASLQARINYNEINQLPQVYASTRDINHVADKIWNLLIKSASSLNSDVDLVHDFCVHFYEKKLRIALELYQSRYTQIPFLWYIIRFTKNDFRNYLRRHRRYEIKEVLHHDISTLLYDPLAFYKENISENHSSTYATVNEKLNATIQALPIAQRTLLKLYLGLILNIGELKQLMHTIGCPWRIQQFLDERTARSAKQDMQRQEYHNRIAQLNYLLHRAPNIQRAALLRKRKKHAQNSLHCHAKLRELTQLAQLFCLSKSTIHRRIELILRQLHQESNINENDPNHNTNTAICADIVSKSQIINKRKRHSLCT